MNWVIASAWHAFRCFSQNGLRCYCSLPTLIEKRKVSMLHWCVQANFLIKHGKFTEHESIFFTNYPCNMQHASFYKMSNNFRNLYKNMVRNFRKISGILQNFTEKFQRANHFCRENFSFFTGKPLIASSSSIKLS